MSTETEERVVVTTFVELAPHVAFEVFTREINAWWKHSPRYRRMAGQAGTVTFEGAPPERLIEKDHDNTTVIGRVLAWEVGKRLALEWYGGDFGAEDRSEVEVRFDAHRSGTRVTLEHRGLGALPANHKARHGFSGEAFEAMLGYFWADLFTGYRMRCGVPR